MITTFVVISTNYNVIKFSVSIQKIYQIKFSNFLKNKYNQKTLYFDKNKFQLLMPILKIILLFI